MREGLTSIGRAAIEFLEDAAAWVGDHVAMPLLNGLGWIFDHPVPFSLTLIAGVLLGLVIGA